MRRLVPLLALLPALAAAGCGGDPAGRDAPSGAIDVVATTTQVADLAANVAGERAGVSSLLPPDADPHDHELRPRDAAALEEADLVLRSGGELDEWAGDALGNAEAPVLDLSQRVRSLPAEEVAVDGEPAGDEHAGQEHAEHEHAAGEAATGGEHSHPGPDPHWWHDPRNAIMAVAAIRDAMISADPDGRSVYEANARAYTRRLQDLDAAIAQCIDSIPADERKLVTTHDSLGHLVDRYDLELVGSVIPSRSTLGQPSAGEIRALVERMRAEEVRAVFPETSVNPELERAIADEAGARVGAPLFADSLGAPGSAGGTYIASMAYNAEAITEALGGEPCDLPD